jgi:hypothetical protein
MLNAYKWYWRLLMICPTFFAAKAAKRSLDTLNRMLCSSPPLTLAPSLRQKGVPSHLSDDSRTQ